MRELIKTGEIKRDNAQDWVQDLVKTSRDRSDTFIPTLRGEVRKPLKVSLTNVDDLAKKTSYALTRPSTVPRKATGRPTQTAAAQKTAARMAPGLEDGADDKRRSLSLSPAGATSSCDEDSASSPKNVLSRNAAPSS